MNNRSDAEKHALLIADKVEPDFRGKGKSCSSWSAKKWQAAYDAVIECFSSVIPHFPLGFEVKKLEWSADVVNTSFGAYTISDDDEGFYFTFHDYPYGVADEARHLTANEAKEAAQSDFERRVRECHVPRPDIKTIIDEIRAGTRQGFLNEGDQPEESDAELSCPYCSGSGHIDDMATNPVDVAAVRRQAFEEAATLIDEGFEKAVGRSWRNDGKSSKNDSCPHDKFMYEDCENCASAAIRALSAEPVEGVQWCRFRRMD